MADQKYDFESTVGIKIIVKKDDKYFLVKEPESNEWMPGRMSLPGGKLLLGESISEGLRRKIETEIGLEIEVLGLIKVMNILMPLKNVYHFVFLAEWQSGEIDLSKIEAENAGWYSKEEVAKFSKDDFAEYYNDQILNEVINENYSIIPLSFVGLQDNRSEDIMSWMKSGMPDKTF